MSLSPLSGRSRGRGERVAAGRGWLRVLVVPSGASPSRRVSRGSARRLAGCGSRGIGPRKASQWGNHLTAWQGWGSRVGVGCEEEESVLEEPSTRAEPGGKPAVEQGGDR